ncbi:MAG: hypothetical protein LBE56_04060 [Tannerella sp.]|jgi:hypothetical protein|nr:hypothetical protein [Tannerella sp.]
MAIFRLITIFILCFLTDIAKAQMTVSARILDAETQQPVPMVSVGAFSDNTVLGSTISNADGDFMVEADSTGYITLSHISYQTNRVNIAELGETILLQPKVIELTEIVVIPRSAIIRELTTVWEKYTKLLNKKKEKDFPVQTFYYRQLTQNNDLNTEYLGCFFTAPTSVNIKTLTLQEGRFARIKKDSLIQMANFFAFSRIRPFSLETAKRKNAVNPFLVKDFEKYYDVRLSRIISPNSDDEVKVYQFIPYQENISENAFMLSGFLYVRTKDHSIVQLEANSNNAAVRGFPNITSQQIHFTVTYREGVESYPIVESVKCEMEIEGLYQGQTYQFKAQSILFAADYSFQSKGNKMNRMDFLLKEVAKSKYNQAFWDNNPIVKRTQIEQQVLDDFNQLGYFGNMSFELSGESSQ